MSTEYCLSLLHILNDKIIAICGMEFLFSKTSNSLKRLYIISYNALLHEQSFILS